MTPGLRRLARWCAGLALLAGLCWHYAGPAAPSQPQPQGKAARAAGPAWFDALVGTPPPTARDAEPPLASQIDSLVATGDPKDAMQAYWLVHTCVQFAAKGDAPIDDGDSPRGWRDRTAAEKQALARLCGGMTERIRQDSYAHLATAAKAGVDGADLEFLSAGPFGDPSALESRPDDPLVLAWKKQALEQLREQAALGKMSSIMFLLSEYIQGDRIVAKDPVASLPYVIAVKADFDELSRRAKEPFANPITDDYLREIEKGMTPQQVAAAEQAGMEMFKLGTKNWTPR